jgi:MFS transporter, SP family, major inositol transporter
MLILALLPAIGLLFGVLFAGVPESPRWLASEERFEEALDVLRKIRRSEQEALDELEEVRKMASEDQQMTIKLIVENHLYSKYYLKSDVLGERWLRRCLLIGIGVAMCNQLAGVNSIMYYGTEILSWTGMGQYFGNNILTNI